MNPMQTAAPIARIRASEANRPASERLFTDPYASLFAETEGSDQVVQLFGLIPFFEEHVRLRTRYIDDAVRKALADGCRHVILIGAGFDCRGLRMSEIPAAGAKVIELDHSAQLAEKKRRLDAAGVQIPAHVVSAPADLSTPGELERALDHASVSPGVRALWVCEGLFGYLAKDDIRELAERTAQRSGPGSSLVANHAPQTWSAEALLDAFRTSAWRAAPGPVFDELYRRFIGPDAPEGSLSFAFLEASL
jgi:methyltransferase (TIGR00027 family)